MAIKILDTLSPLGSFPVAKAENIQSGSKTLDAVLDEKTDNVDFLRNVDVLNAKITDRATQSQLNAVSARVTTNETAITGKVDKVTGKGLSTNDYSDAEKQKVAEAAAVTAFVNGAFELVD